MKKTITLIVVLIVLVAQLSAQPTHSLPSIAYELCDKAPVTITGLTAQGSGGVPKPFCFAGQIHQPTWFKFTPTVSGTFEFVATSQLAGVDFDFVLYADDPFFNNQLACNYAQPFLPTGLTDDPFAYGTFPNPGIDPAFFVDAGQTYYLLIDNYFTNYVGFTIVFGGSFKISATDSDLAPKDAHSCENAPLMDCTCLSWFESGTEQTPYSASVPGFNGTLENPHVYRFTACACVMDFTISINGPCASGIGIEAQVLNANGSGCAGGPISNVTQGAPGTPCSLTATDLNIGQDYFLVIDGINGASCPYVVQVQPYTPPPLVYQDTIYSETSYYCEGDTMAFYIQPVLNVGNCYWIPPPGYDTLQPTHDTLLVIAGHGNGLPQTVCIHLSNGCYDQATLCRTFVVYPDTTVNQTVTLCASELPYNFNGQLLTAFGTYHDTLQTVHGCDSIVHLSLVQGNYCPPACAPYPDPLMAPGDACSAAPLLCGNYLNGYCGGNFGFANNPPPPGGASGGTGQHDAWLRLAPCESTFTLQVGVSDCNLGQGLTFALATGTCGNLTVLGSAQTVAAGTLDTLTWSGALANEPNFLWINGLNGDECQFNIEVIDGIGTGTVTPGTCSCTSPQIEGPNQGCPGDVLTFTLLPGTCTIVPGTVVGGNGYACVPDSVCGTAVADTVELHWHLYDPSVSFVGDSVNVSSVQIQIDPALANYDTLINTQIWASWSIPGGGGGTGGGSGGGGTTTQQDSLTFCDCEAAPCSGGGILAPKPFQIKHDIEHQYCTLNCSSPVCVVNGVPYSSPGTYTQVVSNCKTIIVHISLDINIPLVLPIPTQTICRGDAVTLTAQSIGGGPVFYNWSNSGFGPSITVSPSVTTTYTVIATNPISGCTSTATALVKVIQPIFVNLPPQPLCPGGEVTVCGETFTSLGQHTVVCTSYLGCDSTINFVIVPGPLQTINEGSVGTLTCNITSVSHLGQVFNQPGLYEIIQGCFRFRFTIDQNTAVPVASLSASPSTLCTGESATLTLNTNTPQVSIDWSNSGSGFSQVVTPVSNTTYTVTVTDLANGCTITATATVNVQPATTTALGLVGTITCNTPCVTFGNKTYCAPGTYSDTTGCDIRTFEIDFQKVVVENGVVGTITCAQPCVTFLGQSYCAAGDYTVEDACTIQHFTVAEDLSVPDVVLFPVNICENECFDFYGQTVCSAGTYYHFENCTRLVQVVTVTPFTVNQLGLVGTVTCADPCFTFNNKNYCAAGTYSDTSGCTISTFSIDFQKVVAENGVVGTLTCAQPCVTFFGQNYCAAGDYTVEDACTIQHFTVAEDLSVPDVLLPPVSICENECFDFYGQQICSAGTYYHLENCTRLVQVVNVTPFTVNTLGNLATLTCAQPCFTFNNKNYCVAGTYSDTSGCTISTFSIDFQKVTVEDGVVDTITCAHQCGTFLGQNYCAPGTYTVEDDCTIQHFTVVESISTPVCSAPLANCLPSNTHFTVDFTISGLPPFKVDGNPLNGDYYQSAPLSNGTQYAFVVEQHNGCQTVVSGTFNCSAMCGGEVSLLSVNPAHGCTSGTVQAQTLSTPVAPAGQAVEFVFKTVTGTILERNSTGAFAFSAGTMLVETEYRLAQVVGPTGADGKVDLNNGCTIWSNEQPAIFHAPPTFTVNNPAGVCAGDPVELQANGSLQWVVSVNNGAPLSSSTGQWIWPEGIQQTSTYTVTGTSVWGCSTSVQRVVELYPSPQIETLDLTDPQCAGNHDGLVDVLEVSGGLPDYTYALDNEAFQSDSHFANLGAGSYVVRVRDLHGCGRDSTVLLHDPLPIAVELGPDQEVFAGSEVELVATTSSTVSDIIWQNENTGQQLNDSVSTVWRVKVLGTTSFVCTITDGNGCQASDRLTVTSRRDGMIYHPNVIQPVGADNSGNERFTLFAPAGWVTNIASLSIFDRWGEQVWQNRNLAANDTNAGWDGTVRGHRAEPAVYVFVAVVELVTGEEIVVKGDVTVVR